VRDDLPSGPVTFVFTDVEGSTSLLHALGDEAYAAALGEHRRRIRDAFTAHGGVEVDTQGDAFFYAFAVAAAALRAADAAQDALAGGPIRVRMGVHAGAPLLTDEGYVGEDVHLGARIAAAGHGGQVLVSAATRDAVTAAGLVLSDLGEHRLKDFAGPVAVFQLGSERFPPLKTISNTNLPRPASSFVGREREVGEVVGLLRANRIVTLSGPGGSGKTRLAIEAAATLVPDFKAGVFWVGLATLRDPALVVDTIGSVLGARDGVAGAIGERELLLLLDNLEQVVDAAPQLADLVEACPNLRLLVTSRELLRVRGERAYPVLPLAEPEAVALFAARAAVEPDDIVAELCRRLDNLPLAVELAAARSAVLSPAEILDRLAGRLELLKGGRDADPRQQTLRATIDWSYALLDDHEKALFARLAVFRGGCTPAAAEAVCDADLDTLQSLVDKSLVRHTGGRFWLLETIREYALEQLAEPRLAERHARYYLELAEEASPHVTADEKDWLDRLEAEHDNVRGAFDHFVAAGDTQSAFELVGAVHRFWARRGHFREGGARVERLLATDSTQSVARALALNAAAAMAANTGDVETLNRRAREALALHTAHGDDWGIAYSLLMVGMGAAEAEEFAEGARHMAEAVDRFRALGDDHYAELAMMNLGYFCQVLGDYERADALLGAALESARAAGNRAAQARALGQLATGARQRDRLDEALELILQALPLWDEFGDPAMTARDLRRLARILAHLGRAEEAARALSASEALREQVGHMESWIPQENEEILALVHAQLDDGAFAEAWADGRKLTVGEVLAAVSR
jgi:predicted ATPase/class 3 adenylate cyclase